MRNTEHRDTFSPVMLQQYGRARWKIALALLVCTGICVLVFFLYSLPIAAVLYAAVLCAIFLTVWMIADYRKFVGRMKRIEALTASLSEVVEHLPATDDPLEKCYQELCRAICLDRDQTEEAASAEYEERITYYTLWAHQIKTPIAAMRLLLQTGETDVHILADELFRIEEYVDMAMCYLRLDAQNSDYVIRDLALDDVIRQAIHRYASMFIRKKIRLQYTGTDAHALSDEKWLGFLLGQILSNALKYTHVGGSVEIAIEKPLTLVVRDTGIGIAPEDLPRIFERGYTGGNGRTDKRASGIGLYLCRRIASNLGHTISAVSRMGVGTEIRISMARDKILLE